MFFSHMWSNFVGGHMFYSRTDQLGLLSETGQQLKVLKKILKMKVWWWCLFSRDPQIYIYI